MSQKQKVQLKVAKRSGFDKSHKNLFTATCGTLVPILVDELIPNSTISLKAAIKACLPPLASDTFMNVDYRVEAFVVPMRLLYGGFDRWLTGQNIVDDSMGIDSPVKLPNIDDMSSGYTETTWNQFVKDYYGTGTLADYLGFRTVTSQYSSSNNSWVSANIFPFLAYHKIWSDWYRNSKIQTDCFSNPGYNFYSTGIIKPNSTDQAQIKLSTLPYVTYYSDNNADVRFSAKCLLADGVGLMSLRQRNFDDDYFTCAFTEPQSGDAQKVTIADGEFTISALRAANSLQEYAERNMLVGPRFQDYLKGQYGANLSNGVAQRSIYLGSATIPVYSKGIYANSNDAAASPNQNPFTSVAAQYGSATCEGTCNLADNYTVEEPSILMVIGSLVPKVTYSSGIDRLMYRYSTNASPTEMATPMLETVGNQPIYNMELTGNIKDIGVFGYAQRYADYKVKLDELHGLVRDGESLESFALQRSFTGTPLITNGFLEIPTNYLDQVSAVEGDISKYGVWVDSYFDYKVIQPLSRYSIPSLCNDPDGETISVNLNGSQI